MDYERHFYKGLGEYALAYFVSVLHLSNLSFELLHQHKQLFLLMHGIPKLFIIVKTLLISIGK